MTYADSISALYWAVIPASEHPGWVEAANHLWALWPSPMNADACFEAAGFREFAGPLDGWDRDWAEVIERAITVLETAFGAAHMRETISGDDTRSMLERITGQPRPLLSIAEQVQLATEDDNVPAAVVEFGQDNTAMLRAGDSHEILWLSVPSTTPPHLLHRIAGEMPLKPRELRWSAILPHQEHSSH